MSWLSALRVAGTGMRASSVRMGVIAENLANADATRTPAGGPYRRQVVILGSAPVEVGLPFAATGPRGTAVTGLGGELTLAGARTLRGVTVEAITDAAAPTKWVYDPGHPDADARGYVQMPNVDIPMEIADLTVASRVYQANIAVAQTIKRGLAEALNLLS